MNSFSMQQNQWIIPSREEIIPHVSNPIFIPKTLLWGHLLHKPVKQLTHDKQKLCFFVFDESISGKFSIENQENHSNITHHPDNVDDESAAEEEYFTGSSRQIHQECACKVVQQISIRNKDWDGAEDEDDGEACSDTTKNTDIWDEGSDDEYKSVVAQVDKEESETEIYLVDSIIKVILTLPEKTE